MKSINIVSLNGDGMVNLNKADYRFSASGEDWSARMSNAELQAFLKLNTCILNDLGEIIDLDPDFSDEPWGVVIEIGGLK